MEPTREALVTLVRGLRGGVGGGRGSRGICKVEQTKLVCYPIWNPLPLLSFLCFHLPW